MGYVKQRGSDDVWVVEPADVVSIYRDPNSVVVGIESRYTVTTGPNMSTDSCGQLIGAERSPQQLESYIGRMIMVEDWTRRRGGRLTGFVGVLEKDLRSNREYGGLIVTPYRPAIGPTTQKTQLLTEAEPIVEPLATQTSPTNQNPQ